MSGVQAKERPDPLRECTRYVKIADLSSGSFGFVQLARNTETNELVAIKFIERGDRCGAGCVLGLCARVRVGVGGGDGARVLGGAGCSLRARCSGTPSRRAVVTLSNRGPTELAAAAKRARPPNTNPTHPSRRAARPLSLGASSLLLLPMPMLLQGEPLRGGGDPQPQVAAAPPCDRVQGGAALD